MSNQSPTPPAATTLSVIVPAYREAANLDPLARRVFAAVQNAHIDTELLIVDDDSQDGTEQAVERLIADGLPVRLIVRRGERGLASAVLRGFAEARGRWLLVMDADLSHPPEKIPELVAPLQSGEADFVVGSRCVPGGSTPGWPWHRRFISRGACLLARPFTAVKDPTAGFFALARETWQSASAVNVVGYKIALELLVKCHVKRVREVPISFVDRQAGQSKLTAAVQWHYLRHLSALFAFRWPVTAAVIGYAAVGTVVALVDLLLLNLMMLLGGSFLAARPTSALLALVFSFALHRQWTGPSGASWRRLGGYVLRASPGWLINCAAAVTLYRSEAFFAAHYNVSAIVGVLAGTMISLLIYRWPAFRRPGTPGIQHLWERIAASRAAEVREENR